ncbi:MAG: hypothetical protein N2662_08015, partial [Bacteroidales bacterium]|nr:hypothetical protein [Bacteroidales bacterium]
PGIYRKQYNIAFPIRLGIGSTFANNSVYFYLGPCTQLAFNITSKIILQSQLNFTFGFGGSDNTIIYLPIPSLLTLGLYYKF